MQSEEITPEMVEAFREEGFIRIPQVITPEEAAHYFDAATNTITRYRAEKTPSPESGYTDVDIFVQIVNIWKEDETLRTLTCHPNVGRIAEKLAGSRMRLWHDHILCKMPHNDASTEFHQDQPYWPHAECPHPVSAWIALCDVPVERGCMTFLPGSHRKTDLAVQHLDDPRSLFTICPELEYSPRVTMPLKAGDCTFHHGRCAHMATPNFTDVARIAHVVIYMEEATRYRKIRHIVTDPLDLEDGDPLDGPLFPAVASMTS